MRYLSLLFFLIVFIGAAQHIDPFAAEVMAIGKKYDTIWNPSKETVVFTGSSSIRFWNNLSEQFPEHQIVNSGFGGSQASDLLMHHNALILRFKPKKVFIYEGDNDIASKKKLREIIATLQEIISEIKSQNAHTEIVLIAAKPSIARWNLKRRYKRLNRKFKKITEEDSKLMFADVWSPMLNRNKLKQDLFIEDGLHMNSMGYDIWYDVIKKHM